MLDYARRYQEHAFRRRCWPEKARQFYLDDKQCPLSYEPSGEDFLSPCLGEADAMRRVLPPAEFAAWLRSSCPRFPTRERVIGYAQ